MNQRRSNNIQELRMKVFINRVIKTQVFPKMDTHDQLHSLSKLIALFEADYGVKPRSFEKIFHELSDKARGDMRKRWPKAYTRYDNMIRTQSGTVLPQAHSIEPVQQAIPMGRIETVNETKTQ
jgi:hypothetical protein